MGQNEASFDGTDEVTETAIYVANTMLGCIISQTTSKIELNVDDYIKTIGEFGKAQKLITLIILLMNIPSAYHFVVLVFIGNDSPWTCVSSVNATNFCNFTKSAALYLGRIGNLQRQQVIQL